MQTTVDLSSCSSSDDGALQASLLLQLPEGCAGLHEDGWVTVYAMKQAGAPPGTAAAHSSYQGSLSQQQQQQQREELIPQGSVPALCRRGCRKAALIRATPNAAAQCCFYWQLGFSSSCHHWLASVVGSFQQGLRDVNGRFLLAANDAVHLWVSVAQQVELKCWVKLQCRGLLAGEWKDVRFYLHDVMILHFHLDIMLQSMHASITCEPLQAGCSQEG